ncbi:hypothetical protein HPB49_012856 [Dermacentor silvarum]|uniref:Uncharacterized protein n=1 Tax=Dermacentor silvarum TaxID=543639 RepID=A0ACB8CF28_DERSI|nr:hypothetical protein HPB49_012856 [Dermacentor silvarum]
MPLQPFTDCPKHEDWVVVRGELEEGAYKGFGAGPGLGGTQQRNRRVCAIFSAPGAENKKVATSQHPLFEAAQAAWAQTVPAVLPLNSGHPNFLDQTAHQAIGAATRFHTYWQWAEPLRLVGVKTHSLPTGYSDLSAHLPARVVCIAQHLAGATNELEVTSLFQQLSLNDTPVGDFQAGRLFSVPMARDTRAMACLVAALAQGVSGTKDEAPFLRAVLISECLIKAVNVPLATQLPVRVAGDLKVTGVKRMVAKYSSSAPDGKIMAVDLARFMSMYANVGATEPCFAEFLRDTWGNSTAVVPFRTDLSGLRAAGPYILSFLDTMYWNARTKYVLECCAFASADDKVDLITMPNASLGVVDGEVNVLLVLVDQVVKTNNRLELTIGDQKVPVTGNLRLFQAIRQRVPLPIMVLVRPRAGNFCYTVEEVEAMVTDITLFRQNGAHGFVIGALTR